MTVLFNSAAINQRDNRSVFIYFSNVERATLDMCHIYIRESVKYSDDSFRVLKVGVTNNLPRDYDRLLSYITVSKSKYQRPVAKAVEVLLLHLCELKGERVDADADNGQRHKWFLFDSEEGNKTINMIMIYITNLRLHSE